MLKTRKRSKGSIDRAFAARIRTENQDQASFCSFTLREVSVLAELALGHLRYHLTDVPPQSNSPPDTVLGKDRVRARTPSRTRSTFGGRRTGPRESPRAQSTRDGEARSQHRPRAPRHANPFQRPGARRAPLLHTWQGIVWHGLELESQRHWPTLGARLRFHFTE